MKDSVKCTIEVRRIPLERFRLQSDGRKWNKQARDRRALLLELATYANGDGTFGKFSPSIRTLIETGRSRTTLYRHLDNLKDLNLLDWTRQKHYYKREYRILLPEAGKRVSDSPQEQVSDSKEQVSDSQKQVSQLAASSVYSPSKEPSKEREKTYLSNSTGREQLAEQYFVWLFATYDGLSFGVKSKSIIRDFIVGSNYDLDTLKQGTARILDPLNILDPFTHADNKLVASLPASCEAGILKGEEAKREAARRAAMARQAELAQEQYRREVAADLAEIERKRMEAEEAAAVF